MFGLTRMLALLMLPLGAAAGASSQDPELPATPAAAEGMLMPFEEVDTRLTVPVAVGQKGPFPFIIDTGAERTVVSRELAGTLGLANGKPVMITSMTGRSRVDTVVVPDLSIQSIGKQHRILAPALEARNLGAQGLLGIDTLQDHRVVINFDTGIMQVHPATRRRGVRAVSDDEIVVTARNRYGQLIVTEAWFNNTRIQVVLDTGSQVSMGNNALRRRIGARAFKNLQTVQLTSVTGEKTVADYTLVPKVKVGGVEFTQLPVAFAEVEPFRRFGLTDRPALLLGMDALQSFRQVEIDFPNRQVRFRMPKEGARPPRF